MPPLASMSHRMRSKWASKAGRPMSCSGRRLHAGHWFSVSGSRSEWVVHQDQEARFDAWPTRLAGEEDAHAGRVDTMTTCIILLSRRDHHTIRLLGASLIAEILRVRVIACRQTNERIAEGRRRIPDLKVIIAAVESLAHPPTVRGEPISRIPRCRRLWHRANSALRAALGGG